MRIRRWWIAGGLVLAVVLGGIPAFRAPAAPAPLTVAPAGCIGVTAPSCPARVVLPAAQRSLRDLVADGSLDPDGYRRVRV
jgi:hypothetical protein